MKNNGVTKEFYISSKRNKSVFYQIYFWGVPMDSPTHPKVKILGPIKLPLSTGTGINF